MIDQLILWAFLIFSLWMVWVLLKLLFKNKSEEVEEEIVAEDEQTEE